LLWDYSPTIPKREGIIVEGQPFVLGDVKLEPFAIPGFRSRGLPFH